MGPLQPVELYAQDSWRVNRKLSLELGLRYNIIGPIYSALGTPTFLPSRFDPSKAPTVLASEGSSPIRAIPITAS